jgi:hypothetical protein
MHQAAIQQWREPVRHSPRSALGLYFVKIMEISRISTNAHQIAIIPLEALAKLAGKWNRLDAASAKAEMAAISEQDLLTGRRIPRSSPVRTGATATECLSG